MPGIDQRVDAVEVEVQTCQLRLEEINAFLWKLVFESIIPLGLKTEELESRIAKLEAK